MLPMRPAPADEAALRRRYRHEHEVVLVAAHRGKPLRLEDADDCERYLVDADGFPYRAGVGEELFLDRAAYHYDLRALAHVALVYVAPVGYAPVLHVGVIRGAADDAGVPVGVFVDHRGAEVYHRRDGVYAGDLARYRFRVFVGEVGPAAHRRARGAVREDHYEVASEGGYLLVDALVRARADGEGRDDRGDAYDDAERREHRARLVSAQRRNRGREYFGQGYHTGVLLSLISSFIITPSLKWRMRFA